MVGMFPPYNFNIEYIYDQLGTQCLLPICTCTMLKCCRMSVCAGFGLVMSFVFFAAFFFSSFPSNGSCDVEVKEWLKKYDNEHKRLYTTEFGSSRKYGRGLNSHNFPTMNSSNADSIIDDPKS